MLLNIVTGRGVPIQHKEDIVVLISSLPEVQRHGTPFVFTDRHAYLVEAEFSQKIEDLAEFIPWNMLQAKNFKHDPENPEKTVRYQAEALIYNHLPASALLGIATYTDEVRATVEALLTAQDLQLKVVTRPNWFFR